ncbi:hypothetical protein QN277_024443 [Acacia crassicarpa]|uniref:RNase H type-1 domain-containing protein n=1 Tax=Acacia crassicarpa TaxID=499986 RepID=A0AAE1MHC0_9FABA|nr:hypothetical protein QN277_024443 [Acacia crassicarpa]
MAPGGLLRVSRVVQWMLPPAMMVASNCDGAKKKESMSAGASSLLRDCSGRWLGGCCRNNGNCSSLQSELWALMDGLELVWGAGYKEVQIQVDCLVAIGLVQDSTDHPNGNIEPRTADSKIPSSQVASLTPSCIPGRQQVC